MLCQDDMQKSEVVTATGGLIFVQGAVQATCPVLEADSRLWEQDRCWSRLRPWPCTTLPGCTVLWGEVGHRLKVLGSFSSGETCCEAQPHSLLWKGLPLCRVLPPNQALWLLFLPTSGHQSHS